MPTARLGCLNVGERCSSSSILVSVRFVDEPKQPDITLKREHLTCLRHGEPYRKDWPKGYMILSLMLFEAVIALNSLQDEIREVTGSEKADLKSITPLLKKRPACCRVPAATMFEIYLKSKIGVLAKCLNCRRKRLGTEYRTKARVYDHICFECVLHRISFVN